MLSSVCLQLIVHNKTVLSVVVLDVTGTVYVYLSQNSENRIWFVLLGIELLDINPWNITITVLDVPTFWMRKHWIAWRNVMDKLRSYSFPTYKEVYVKVRKQSYTITISIYNLVWLFSKLLFFFGRGGDFLGVGTQVLKYYKSIKH